MLVMGGAVPQLHSSCASSSSSLVRKSFAAAPPSCIRTRNHLHLPGRRSDVVLTHRFKRTAACVAATVSTRVYDGLAEDREDFIKAGGEELDLVQLQANKSFEQPKIADKVSNAVYFLRIVFLDQLTAGDSTYAALEYFIASSVFFTRIRPYVVKWSCYFFLSIEICPP